MVGTSDSPLHLPLSPTQRMFFTVFVHPLKGLTHATHSLSLFCLCSDKFIDSSSLHIKGMHLVLHPSNRLLEVYDIKDRLPFLDRPAWGKIIRLVHRSVLCSLARFVFCQEGTAISLLSLKVLFNAEDEHKYKLIQPYVRKKKIGLKF